MIFESVNAMKFQTCDVSASSCRHRDLNLLLEGLIGDPGGREVEAEDEVNRLHQDPAPVDGVEREQVVLG